MSIFVEVSLILLIATSSALLMKLLRQPLLVGYILAGIISGPEVLNLLQSTDQFEFFSKLGVTILLFILGMNLSPKAIQQFGFVALVAGAGQVIFTAFTGFVLVVLLGMRSPEALYVSVALAFSSTIIVLKLLSDKGDLQKLYGRMAVGFMLVQDILAVVVLMLVSPTTQGIGTTAVKGGGIVILLLVASRFVLPILTRFAASSSELLFLFSIAWGFGLSSLFFVLGFSMEVGSLLAGITLSVTPFAEEIASRLKPLRDFFIILFFVMLGSGINMQTSYGIFAKALIISLFVLIAKPLTAGIL